MPILALKGELNLNHVASLRFSVINAQFGDDLTIILDSNGGNLAPAFQLCDLISNYTFGKTIGRVNGRCDSAAILVLSACQERSARLGAKFHMHSTGLDRTELRDHVTGPQLLAKADTLARLDTRCRKLIAGNIGCDLGELERLEQSGSTLNAPQALELGLLTEITDAPAMTARAAQRRKARSEAKRHSMWKGGDLNQLAAMGMVNHPLGIAPQALKAFLASRGGR